MRILPVIAAVAAAFLVVSCSAPNPPQGVTVVRPFNAQQFMGSWYEIARFDHRYERALQQVTAHYSLMSDGGIQVINRGYNPDRGMWQKMTGKAYFTGASDTAALKASFIGPFYGGYNVIALDKNYQHALVCGADRDYLWVLSRTPTISDEMKQRLLDSASRQGFDISQLVWVEQTH